MISTSGVQCRAIADHVLIAGPPQVIMRAFDFLRSNLFDRTGLTMSSSKTEFYSPSFVSSDPARAAPDLVCVVNLCNSVGAKMVMGDQGLRVLGRIVSVNDSVRKQFVAEVFDELRITVAKLRHETISTQATILVLRQCTASETMCCFLLGFIVL
jgi:hypothetical protein